jgi:hypothetical protein
MDEEVVLFVFRLTNVNSKQNSFPTAGNETPGMISYQGSPILQEKASPWKLVENDNFSKSHGNDGVKSREI